jgi:hypothetical protein
MQEKQYKETEVKENETLVKKGQSDYLNLPFSHFTKAQYHNGTFYMIWSARSIID